MNQFIILSKEQLQGEKALDIFKKMGLESEITDYAIVMGCFATKKDSINKGWWWTSTCLMDISDHFDTGHAEYYPNDIATVFESGSIGESHVDAGGRGVRPAIRFSTIASMCGPIKVNHDGIKETEWGEYPQTVVSPELANTLDRLFEENALTATGKTYKDNDNQYIDLVEYEYQGERYVCFERSRDTNGSKEFLSTDEEVKRFQTYWLKVEPITWLIDEKNDIALSQKILFHMYYDKRKGNNEIKFEDSDIKYYLDTTFSKEIIPTEEYKQIYGETTSNRGRK